MDRVVGGVVPVLPLTWHTLRKCVDDVELCKGLAKLDSPDAKRFVQADAWEREARPGAGPSVEVQALMDKDLASINRENSDSSESD